MELFMRCVLFCRTASTEGDIGNANTAVARGIGTILSFYVIGNEAGWFPQIQVRHLSVVLGLKTLNKCWVQEPEGPLVQIYNSSMRCFKALYSTSLNVPHRLVRLGESLGLFVAAHMNATPHPSWTVESIESFQLHSQSCTPTLFFSLVNMQLRETS